MTLVEILVVLAVLAMLTAVAVPGFIRMGLFSRNDLLSSARELHALLNSAKIYAVTYRVPTAVVYDSPVAGETINMFRAAAMLYKHPNPATVDKERFKSTDEVFMPVVGDEGNFRIFSGAACLVDPPGVKSEKEEVIVGPGGMTSVTVFFPDNWDEPVNRYANVFEPSGRLRQASRERYVLALGYDPTETEDTERLDQDGVVRAVKIEIYRSTGRVQVVKGEGDV